MGAKYDIVIASYYLILENFGRLVLGCIETDFCYQILILQGKTRKQTQIGRTGRLGRPTCPGAGKVLCTIVYQYRKLTRQESRKDKTGQDKKKKRRQESRHAKKAQREESKENAP